MHDMKCKKKVFLFLPVLSGRRRLLPRLLLGLVGVLPALGMLALLLGLDGQHWKRKTEIPNFDDACDVGNMHLDQTFVVLCSLSFTLQWICIPHE